MKMNTHKITIGKEMAGKVSHVLRVRINDAKQALRVVEYHLKESRNMPYWQTRKSEATHQIEELTALHMIFDGAKSITVEHEVE